MAVHVLHSLLDIFCSLFKSFVFSKIRLYIPRKFSFVIISAKTKTLKKIVIWVWSKSVTIWNMMQIIYQLKVLIIKNWVMMSSWVELTLFVLFRTKCSTLTHSYILSTNDELLNRTFFVRSFNIPIWIFSRITSRPRSLNLS